MNDPTDFPTADYVAVCETPDCGNHGIEIQITAAAESPQVQCGACGEQIPIRG